MASTTTNLGLTKPASGEAYNLDVFNQNFQKIDDFAGHVYLDQSSVGHPLDTSGYALSFEAFGKMRMLTFRGLGRAHTEDEVFLTIPQGHRPPGDRYFIGSIAGTSVPIRMKANGDVEIYSINGATKGGVRLYCSLIWIID